MKKQLLNTITNKSKNGLKQLSVLVDPDHVTEQNYKEIAENCMQADVDLLFVGGSLITNGHLDTCIDLLKSACDIPIILFPGDLTQISNKADGILLLSLISGRNPELLIGKHVIAAPRLKKSDLEIIPTGYMLIDGGNITSVSYMSNTTPIPADKPDIAAATAIAGEMLGLQAIYMDAGSGAKNPISQKMIKRVKQNVDIPVIVGGGMRTAAEAVNSCLAGADIIVIGNAIEEDINLVKEMSEAIHSIPAEVLG